MKDLSIYVHIPFCVRKCNYCDFLSFSMADERKENYIEALLREIELEADALREEYVVRTVFFGGGTPSLLEVSQVKKIMDKLRENFIFSEDMEISMEVNPGTVTKEKLSGFKDAGMNRISIGLQSANDKELALLGRIHSYESFLECYKIAVLAGFTNINVDVMSALPGQSVESYLETLHRVVTLNPKPTHISAYSLIVEEGTPFAKEYELGRLALPSEDEERTMYELTEKVLNEYGYHRYEISNYALPGYECRHNKVYWIRKDYLGLGLGAASLIKEERRSNVRELEKYCNNPQTERETEVLSAEEQMSETFILGLRLMEGVSKECFAKTFGCEAETVFGEAIAEHVKNGLLVNGDSIKLTAKGIDVSNRVMVSFLK